MPTASSAIWNGWACTGTGWNGSRNGWTATPPPPTTLRAAGRFYECFETPTELDLKRKKQLNMGRPPVYDRAALALTDAERDRAEGREGYWRFKLDQERIEWADGILGRHLHRRGQRVRPGADPRRRAGALHPRLGRR
jgi:hypothetical protein